MTIQDENAIFLILNYWLTINQLRGDLYKVEDPRELSFIVPPLSGPALPLSVPTCTYPSLLICLSEFKPNNTTLHACT